MHGNTIAHVLATQNEFAIYEIDTTDINNRLRVLIDGHSEESERKLINKFDHVKQEYVKAKGMLYRSSNLGMMKNRIAHALASCLGSDDPSFDGNTLFKVLCADLEKEQKRIIANRFFYLLPVVLCAIFWFLVCYALRAKRITNTPDWQVVSGFLAASLGAGVSMFIGVKKLHFEEFPYSRFYAFFGIERVLFAFFVSAVAYIAIKSGLLASSLLEKTYWANLMLLVAAGYSEHYAPSLIKRV